MFLTHGLTNEEIALFNKTYQDLDRYFSLKIEAEPAIDVQSFQISKHYQRINVREYITIEEGDCNAFLTYTEVEYKVAPSKYGSGFYKEYQLWAGAFFSKSYGHILIRPETFEDRLRELFTPLEVDLDDKEFSSKYYVLAKDELTAAAMFTPAFREALKKSNLKDFYLEVKKDTLLISSRKSLGVNPELLASFAFNISELRL